jgi:hypothetical protein
MLEQRLADSLYDSTMDLALEQERVNGVAKIVDYRVAFDGDSAGIWIDLDLDDVATVD